MHYHAVMFHYKQWLSQKKEQENIVSVKQKKSHYITNEIIIAIHNAIKMLSFCFVEKENIIQL